MPLPDERPHRSVANLINRFDQSGRSSASLGQETSPPKPIQIPGRVFTAYTKPKDTIVPPQGSAPETVVPSDLKPEIIASAPPEPSSPKLEVKEALDVISAPAKSTATSEPIAESAITDSAINVEPEIAPDEVKSSSNPAPKQLDRKLSTKSTIAPSHSRATQKSSTSEASTTKQPRSSSAKPPSTSTRASRPAQDSKITPAAGRTLSPTPHYMTPLRAQLTGNSTHQAASTNTGGGRATPQSQHSKAPVVSAGTTTSSKPRTSLASGGSSGLMAPTASSLAKARPPVAASARSTTSSSSLKSGAKKASPAEGKQPPNPPQTPPRNSSSSVPLVPFPSVRKAKSKTSLQSSTTAPPSASTRAISVSSAAVAGGAPKSATTAPTGPPARRVRASQSTSRASPAVLAARAKVANSAAAGVPPVPSVPLSASVSSSIGPKSQALSASISTPNPIVSFPSSSHSKDSTAESLVSAGGEREDDVFSSGVVSRVVPGGSGEVVVTDLADGTSTTAPPAQPLTEGALEAHDVVDSSASHSDGPPVMLSAENTASTAALIDGDAGKPISPIPSIVTIPDDEKTVETSPVPVPVSNGNGHVDVGVDDAPAAGKAADLDLDVNEKEHTNGGIAFDLDPDTTLPVDESNGHDDKNLPASNTGDTLVSSSSIGDVEEEPVATASSGARDDDVD